MIGLFYIEVREFKMGMEPVNAGRLIDHKICMVNPLPATPDLGDWAAEVRAKAVAGKPRALRPGVPPPGAAPVATGEGVPPVSSPEPPHACEGGAQDDAVPRAEGARP